LGRFSLTAWQQEPTDTLQTMEALQRRLDNINEAIISPDSYALKDLRFLSLEAVLAPRAVHEEQARALLAETYFWHANHYSHCNRLSLIACYIERAMRLSPGKLIGRIERERALILLARSYVH